MLHHWHHLVHVSSFEVAVVWECGFASVEAITLAVKREFPSDGSNSWGRKDFISRCDILDELQNILNRNVAPP
jgi:hypothetical protein